MRGPLTRYLRDSVKLGFWNEDNLYGSVIPVSSSSNCNVAFCLRSYQHPVSIRIPRCISLRALCFFNFILGMSRSEPGEMAPESSKVVTLPKFDMHIYTSELTSSELKEVVEEYCIPLDDESLTVTLCKQGHWFSFKNKTSRGTRKCFKEVTSSLKGLKKKFFLINRRAISDAMPWRHGDTDLHDDFLTHYNASDAARLSEVLVPLRPPPRHLLYVCGLTTACRHSELRYDNKDQHNNVIDMDTFLKLPSWTGTVVSRGDPISDDQRPKPRVTPPLEAGAKIPDLTAIRMFKKEVDLVCYTRRDHSSGCYTQPSAILNRTTAQSCYFREDHSSQSSHLGHEDEQVNNQYVPNWGLQNDLRVCTFHCSYIRCPSREKELLERLKDLERERDEWRVTASSQVERIRGLEKELEPRVQQLAVVEGKTKGLENEKLALSSKVSLCFTAGWLGGLSLGRSEDEIVQILSESEDLDIKRSRSWEAKHRELFTKSYPYIQKIADSYDLPMDELLKVSPDVPSATDKGNTSRVGTGESLLIQHSHRDHAYL
ncbi:hypothetical protein Tco_0805426 [Tanacetum coccineum]